jgi:hypothetical protein
MRQGLVSSAQRPVLQKTLFSATGNPLDFFTSTKSAKSPVCRTPPGREKSCVTNGFTSLMTFSSLSINLLIAVITTSDYNFYLSFYADVLPTFDLNQHSTYGLIEKGS